MRVESNSFYKDNANSIIDYDILHDNYKKTLSLRNFVYQLSRLVDDGEILSRNCAIEALRRWAIADALLDQPKNFAGIRERQRFVLALDVVVLKLIHRRSLLPSEVIVWVSRLNHRVMDDFSNRNAVDNLEIWSAVNAALCFLINNDLECASYADRYWALGVGAIREDGFVEAELLRASMSLHYHQYYADALLFLRAAREAGGAKRVSAESQKISMLVHIVESGVCDDEKFFQKIGIHQVKDYIDINNIILSIFKDDIGSSDCFEKKTDFFDGSFGGDLGYTYKILKNFSK